MNEICKLEHLDWDTELLGFPCGRLVNQSGSARLKHPFALKSALEQVSPGYFVTIRLAEELESCVSELSRLGANLIDTELRFIRNRLEAPEYVPPDGVTIEFVKNTNGHAYLELAQAMSLSRFFKDARFGEENALKLWRASLLDHCHGYANELVVASIGDQPAGLVTLHFEGDSNIRLHIVGVLPGFQGRGIAKYMFQALIQRYGASFDIEVETQAINGRAQKLYQDSGFSLGDITYILHYWS